MLRNLSINKKLTLLTLVVCLTSLVLGTVALVLNELRTFRENSVRELSSQARILGGLSTAALSFNDSATATEMLVELKSQPHIHSGAIYQNGRIFARYQGVECDVPVPEEEPLVSGHRFEGRHIVLVSPIEFKGERLGTIHLIADTQGLSGRLTASIVILFTVFVASTLLALLLASRLRRVISDPIQRLSETAAEIASTQNYSIRAVKPGNDELGRLTDVFNQMLERIQAQDRQLKESRERYEVAVAGSSDGLWDLDLRNATSYYSPRCKTMLGYPAEAVLDDQAAWRTLTHPDDTPRVDKLFIDCWTGSQSAFEVEFRVRARDGEYKWILARGAVLRDANGHPHRIAGSHTDITGRKQAEAALLESESRFRSLIQSANEGIVQVDGTGRIASWNRGGEEMFGYLPDELLGESYLRIFPEADRASHEERKHRYMEGRAVSRDRTFEAQGLSKAGVVFPIEVSSFSWTAGGQSFLGFILRDITERKHAESELEELNRKVVETSRLAGMAEVATGVLHNVGNVLNSVNVSATLVFDRLKQSKTGNLARIVAMLKEHEGDIAAFLTTDPKGRMVLEYLGGLSEHLQGEVAVNMAELRSLESNVDHIKQIVAMQQSYARVAGVMELLPAAELVEDALKVVSASFTKSGVTIHRDFEPADPVLVDRHRVLQVLINLFTNARQSLDEAGPEIKRVEVSIRPRDSGSVEIVVRDNGLGISPENLTRVFQHGFTTKKEGHGFGLHSGANALKETGGSLTASSGGPGQGASFMVVLPVKSPDHVSKAA